MVRIEQHRAHRGQHLPVGVERGGIPERDLDGALSGLTSRTVAGEPARYCFPYCNRSARPAQPGAPSAWTKGRSAGNPRAHPAA